MKMAKPNEENAGYYIMQYENYSKIAPRYIVLGWNPKTNMWVTWHCNAPDDFSIGHYMNNEHIARADFHARLAEEYKTRYELSRI